MNGVAEHKNRTIHKVTASLTHQANVSHIIIQPLDARTQEILVNSGLPEKLWLWAV